MAQSPRVVIEVPFAERIEKLWQEYVVERHQQTLAFYSASGEGAEGSERAEHAFAQYLIDSLMRVQKRLGGQRTKEILALMEAAIARQAEDKFASHRDWLTALTQDYYDPMYIYQLEKRKERVVFRGDRSAVMEWLASADNR
jgi:tRNA 2-selenouridine synthase